MRNVSVHFWCVQTKAKSEGELHGFLGARDYALHLVLV